jgi:type I restriction enzyme S subunit
MPENWITYKLSEITSKIGSGATPRGGKEAYKNSGISLIRSQNVLDFAFSIDGLAFIDEKQAAKLKNVEIESKDVLLNITGDSVARVCQVPDEWIPARVNQHVAIVRADNKLLNPDFLKYSLLTYENKNELLNLSSAGATRKAITKSMIEDYKITIPEIKEQQAIASILSTLDDKIENNLAMNKTLEDMADKLFEEWFFENDEKDWETIKLQDLIEIRGGFSYKGKFIGTGDALLLGMGCVSFNRRFLDSGARNYSGECSKNHLVVSGDLVIATRQQSENMPILGYPAKIPISLKEKTIIVGTNLYKVTNESYFSNDILFQLLRSSAYRKQIMANTKGSTVRMITKDAIELFEFKIPPRFLLKKYDKTISSISSQIEHNMLENQTLTKLRDTLLPKLISGEVRVKDLEQQVSEAL